MSASAYAGPPPPDLNAEGLVPVVWPADRIIGYPSDVSDTITVTGSHLFDTGGAEPVSLEDLVKQSVEAAMRDPALLAAALVKLPPAIRDQVRVMLDALEQGSEREKDGEP